MISIEELFSTNKFIIKQHKEWLEIFTGFETKNKYIITDEHNNSLGYIIEEGKGFIHFIKRIFLKSHRPLKINITNPSGEKILFIGRPFFWFFSDLFIEFNGIKYGSLHRRFAILSKRYDLYDSDGNIFAKIKSPIWRLWQFPIYNTLENKIAVISKKWQGLLKEAFTDADAFLIQIDDQSLTLEQKVVIFCSGISIDFDFFENNQGSSSLLNILDS